MFVFRYFSSLLTFARLVSHQAVKDKCFDLTERPRCFISFLWCLLDGLMECIVSTQVTAVLAAKTRYFYNFRHFWWYSHLHKNDKTCTNILQHLLLISTAEWILSYLIRSLLLIICSTSTLLSRLFMENKSNLTRRNDFRSDFNT